MGSIYGDGYGVPQDYELAVKWFRKSAEQGLQILNAIWVWCMKKDMVSQKIMNLRSSGFARVRSRETRQRKKHSK